MTTEVILRNMLQEYGLDFLKQEQRLCAMISDLFAHDIKTKKLLLLSVKEQVPQQMAALHDDGDCELKLNAIQNHLTDEGIFNEGAIFKIVNIWRKALNFNEPEETFDIIWQHGYCGFHNSRKGMITQFKYDDAQSFDGDLAKVKLNGLWGLIDKTGNEIIPLNSHDFYFRDGLAIVTIDKKSIVSH